MDYLQTYNQWLAVENLDPDIRSELEAVKDDDKQIRELFYQNLEFGTGGLRGIIGAGTARMNIYTVRRATQGLAQYIIKSGNQHKGAAIAFDSRNKSALFASEAARVFAGNGIKAYLFDELRPTPQLSFTVRHLGCAAGIVITASHNPAKYNGYKVYGEDGGQCALEASQLIIEEINGIDAFTGVKMANKQQAIDQGLIEIIGGDIDQAYIEQVYARSINPNLAAQAGDGLKIVYTPFHGAGNKPVRRIFDMIGVKNVYLVEEQLDPDGDFPTVASPNPEDKEGFNLAVALANKHQADLIIGTDPDSDRVGIMVRTDKGQFMPLTGNQTGVLLTHYILSCLKEKGTMPQNPFVVKTIVTSELVRNVCDEYGVELIDVLTGFKFIGEKIKELHETGIKSFVFGFEESYGYLSGTYCRDKDAVVASMLIAEMAAFYRIKGMSLYEALQSLFSKYGVHMEGVKNIVREGVEGAVEIREMMRKLRANVPTEIAGVGVVSVSDYSTGEHKTLEDGNVTPTGLPTSDVLRFILQDGTWVAFRPSGTEPKFKVYYGVSAQTAQGAQEKIEALSKDVDRILGN